MTTQELVTDVLADGIVDASEVAVLRTAFYADGIIDKEEAEYMFQINDAVSGNNNDETYKQLFVDVLSDYVLKDEETPGVIDAEEGQFIVDGIEGDGQLDDAEIALLKNLKAKAVEIQSPTLNQLIDSLS
jgi:hypothetical protein